MADPILRKRKITDYLPDPHNANRGTERGQYMIDHSLETVGAARSIVAAADDTIPAGNKTLQAALDAGIEDVIEVETDGRALVVVKRTDWPTVDSEAARQYAYLDNRASEVGLAWDPEQVLADLSAGIDLSDMFHDWELDLVLGKVADNANDIEQAWRGMPEFEQEGITLFHSLRVNFLTEDDLKAFSELIGQAIMPKTISIHYPKKEQDNWSKYSVADES